jgi:benzil reductase ((S)-benzoin forming)
LNYFFITGTSKGIGRALANEVLQQQYQKVFGISRGVAVNHAHYVHFHLDLSDPNAVSNFKFPELKDARGIFLVNNAGLLGEVAHSGDLQNEKIISVYNTNIIAPSILINKFIERYRASSTKKVILNISSGAAQRPIDGWSNYCASKAALEMLSKTVQEESKIDKTGFRVFSVAPGVVDTAMQDQIRTSSKKDFSAIETFKEYKESGQLQHAEVVARKLIYFLENHDKFDDVVISLKSTS